jgi:hypothetical protein
MHLPARPPHEIRVVQQVGLVGVLYTKGIDPGTIRLVAQRLNHYATPGLISKGGKPKVLGDEIFNVPNFTNTVIKRTGLGLKPRLLSVKLVNNRQKYGKAQFLVYTSKAVIT